MSSSTSVIIVPTGVANMASVLAGLTRAGARPRLADGPEEIENALRVVLPGVGAFGAAMARLRHEGWHDPLVDRLRSGRPTLAVCLGLQLLCRDSEESPGVGGMGIIPESVRRFVDCNRVPQLGWNAVEPDASCRFLRPGHAYFANSYRLPLAPQGWSAAYAEYGGKFVAAMERGDVLACQFHPELSGEWGVALLRRWLDGRC